MHLRRSTVRRLPPSLKDGCNRNRLAESRENEKPSLDSVLNLLCVYHYIMRPLYWQASTDRSSKLWLVFASFCRGVAGQPDVGRT